ncbi:MAG: hypothetical protein ACOY0T_09480 [Myxococcota bacterium]
MGTKYDSGIIQKFADRLYLEADKIVYFYGIAGAALGVGAGFFVGKLTVDKDSTTPMLFLGGACCAVFLVIGRARSFALRLQAQTALCQLQIERNTRRARDDA